MKKKKKEKLKNLEKEVLSNYYNDKIKSGQIFVHFFYREVIFVIILYLKYYFFASLYSQDLLVHSSFPSFSVKRLSHSGHFLFTGLLE